MSGLAIAWLVVAPRHDTSPPTPAPSRAVPALPTAAGHEVGTSTLRAWLAGAGPCVDVGTAPPEVTCSNAGVRVDARLLGPSGAERFYASASGARIADRRGPPACARGSADERTWSRPAAPARPVGRYRCRLEHGYAAMWWTDEHGLVAHAVAADGDLAKLFGWWRAHPVA